MRVFTVVVHAAWFLPCSEKVSLIWEFSKFCALVRRGRKSKCESINVGQACSLRFGEKFLIHFYNVYFRLWLAVQVVQVCRGIILAIGFGSCAVCPLGLGLGEHFASFHLISSLCVLWRRKCRFSFQPHHLEGYLLFQEMA